MFSRKHLTMPKRLGDSDSVKRSIHVCGRQFERMYRLMAVYNHFLAFSNINSQNNGIVFSYAFLQEIIGIKENVSYESCLFSRALSNGTIFDIHSHLKFQSDTLLGLLPVNAD
ncbi:hypothetical protein C0J52_12222 [Blattella germanica]|nr:hypothetical protein C0J52_12222 [Blattella germanica]